MVRFSPKLKKFLLLGTVILLGCDVSMLFASPTAQSSTSTQANPQLQQLQTQVQAQIQALQNQPANAVATSSSSALSDTVGANVANQILSNQKPQNNILPPSPYNQTPEPATALPTPQATSTQPPPSVLQNIQQQQLANQSLGKTNPDAIAQSPFSQQIPLPSASQNTLPPPGISGNVPDIGTAIPTTGSGAAISTTTASPSAVSTVSDADISDAAFSAMVKNALPMSPDQIQKLRSVYMASQFAASSSPIAPPRPTATSQFVDLSPGATPPVIRLAQGFVTSLVFVDSTGAPWPIASYDVGNPSAFNIQWDKTSNTLMVQSTVLYNYGNLAVRLRGLDTPVMLTLIPGQKAVDYRVDLRVQGLGPNHQPLVMNTLPASTDSDLLNVLDGVPPPNSTVLSVEGGDCQAWSSGDKMYVRTRLNILSPGWVSTLSSADGMHAYEMQPTPMLLVSQNGEVLQLKVEGF
jgi:intracellular multiplication protein IcmK